MAVNFQDSRLLEKYGSWIRVQVAFYDFLFKIGSNLCPEHFRESAVAGILFEGAWADGSDIYEETVTTLEQHFGSPDEAWSAFIQYEFS